MALPIMAIAQAAKAAVPLAKSLGSTFSRAAIADRKTVKQDVEKLKKDNFGYSDAQKNTAIANQLGAIRAQSQAAMDANNRQGAAAGGGLSGRYFQNTQAIAQQAENQAGMVGGQVQQSSDQAGAVQRAAALANIQRKARENYERSKKQPADPNATQAPVSTGSLTSAFDMIKGGK
jgi:hypothetical protein